MNVNNDPYEAGSGKGRIGEMSEKPIIFSGSMIRAILAGVKTQTRRIVKPQPTLEHGEPSLWRWENCQWSDDGTRLPKYVIDKYVPYYARYRVGDRLWVKETWTRVKDSCVYKATMRATDIMDICWRPSIYMRRCDSQITLEVTGIRMELLNEIAEKDAIAEGCKSVDGYRELWNFLHAKRGFGWDSNPWVWVIDFERVPEA